MRETLKIIGLLFLIAVFVVSVLGFVYGILAGVWQYNPTELTYFNSRLAITSLMSVFITVIIMTIIAKMDNDQRLF